MSAMGIPPEVNLEVIEGNDQGVVFPVDEKTLTLGRGEGCDILLSDPYISAKHCQIVFREDHFTIIDLNSLNKTKINDAEHLQRNLEHGDVLSLGKTKIKFHWKDQNNFYKWKQEL